VRVPRLRHEREAGDDRDAVLVGDDEDVLDVARGRHRRADVDRHRDDRAVLGDERDLELFRAIAGSSSVSSIPGAEIDVNPDTSTKRTVTCFRSPSSALRDVRIFSARCFGV